MAAKKPEAKKEAPKVDTRGKSAVQPNGKVPSRAELKGIEVRKKNVARAVAATKGERPNRVRHVSPKALSAMVEKGARAERPASAHSDAKLGKDLAKVSKALDAVARGKTVVSKAARAKAEAQVVGRGRKADPSSARQQALKARQAKLAAGGTVKRGRPETAEGKARREALEAKRAERQKDGKTARGREARPDSRRSVQKVRAARKAVGLESRGSTLDSPKGSKGLTPSAVRSGYGSMKRESVAGGDGIEERGLHKRGLTTVTYARGGTHKMRRRTFTFKGKKGEEARVHVMQNLRADDKGDRFRPFHSFRQKDAKDHKVQESIKHDHADPRKARRVRFETTRSAAGLEGTKTEVLSGRRSVTKAERGKRGKVVVPSKKRAFLPATGLGAHSSEPARDAGRSALRTSFSSMRDGTQHRAFDVSAHPAPEPKVPLSRGVGRLLIGKTKTKAKNEPRKRQS